MIMRRNNNNGMNHIKILENDKINNEIMWKIMKNNEIIIIIKIIMKINEIMKIIWYKKIMIIIK